MGLQSNLKPHINYGYFNTQVPQDEIISTAKPAQTSEPNGCFGEGARQRGWGYLS